MTALYRKLLVCLLVGCGLSLSLAVAALLGRTHVGVLTMGAVLAGLCVLWPLLVFAIIAAGRDRLKRAAEQLPLQARIVVPLIFALDVAEMLWLSNQRPGATNIQLSDFSDVLVVQSWSLHALLLYAMAAAMLFAIVRALRTA
jgi:polyferredoxin